MRQIEKVPEEMRKGLRVVGTVRLLDVLEELFIFPREEEGEEEGREGGGREGRTGNGSSSRAYGREMVEGRKGGREGEVSMMVVDGGTG